MFYIEVAPTVSEPNTQYCTEMILAINGGSDIENPPKHIRHLILYQIAKIGIGLEKYFDFGIGNVYKIKRDLPVFFSFC